MKFELSDKELKKANRFINSQKKKRDNYVGAVGGAFSYNFTQTGIGVVSVIIDNITHETLDITDYDTW